MESIKDIDNESEVKRKLDFRLSEKGEFALKLYLDKLSEYRKDLDVEKIKEDDLKLDIFEAVIKAEELDDYKRSEKTKGDLI